ncbi:MAG: SH3 domain-containing protein [Jaaginema sp. PMC 1080.18]|nr:SH3 domain-containing protein [Jaaginema sp. PMC 1080.18]MEC4866954.1 SH3 domain-containing protein [Jaaginema sp. PMC 1078.18]
MSLLSLVGVAVSVTVPGNAIAQQILPDNTQIAQNSIIGQCRAVNRRVSLYSSPAAANPVVSLEANTEVVLRGEGNNGWIVVSVPAINQAGFVQTVNLKNCANAGNNGNTPNSVCRRIIYGGAEGMVVRANPSTNSQKVGSLRYDQRLNIDPSKTFRDSLKREWVQVLSPVNGWMSNGFPGTSNVGLCP